MGMAGDQALRAFAAWVGLSPLLAFHAPFDQTASFLTGTTRVTANGQPLALDSGSSTCAATGTPLRVVQVQSRVVAQ